MESLKQEVTNALNQLPNTAEIEDMIAVLNQMKLERSI
jgi:Tfp pilus assembly protein PilO